MLHAGDHAYHDEHDSPCHSWTPCWVGEHAGQVREELLRRHASAGLVSHCKVMVVKFEVVLMEAPGAPILDRI